MEIGFSDGFDAMKTDGLQIIYDIYLCMHVPNIHARFILVSFPGPDLQDSSNHASFASTPGRSSAKGASPEWVGACMLGFLKYLHGE